jgi:hypothetical protein
VSFLPNGHASDAASALGFDGDPVPGDPQVLQAIVDDFAYVRDVAWSVSQGLDAVVASASGGGFEGEVADALRQVVSGRLKAFVYNIAQAFSLAGEAVAEYRAALVVARQAVGDAVARAAGPAVGDARLAGLRGQVQEQLDRVGDAARVMEAALRDAAGMVSQPIVVPKLWDRVKGKIMLVLTIIGGVLALASTLIGDAPGAALAAAAWGSAGAQLGITVSDYVRHQATWKELLLTGVGLLLPGGRGLFSAEQLGAAAARVVDGAVRAGRVLRSPAELVGLVGRALPAAGRGVAGVVWAAGRGLRMVPGALGRGLLAVWRVLGAVPGVVAKDFAVTMARYPRLAGFAGVLGWGGRVGVYAGVRAWRWGVAVGVHGLRLGVALFTPLRVSEIAELGYRGAWAKFWQEAAAWDTLAGFRRGYVEYMRSVEAAKALAGAGAHGVELGVHGEEAGAHAGTAGLHEPELAPVLAGMHWDQMLTTLEKMPQERFQALIGQASGIVQPVMALAPAVGHDATAQTLRAQAFAPLIAVAYTLEKHGTAAAQVLAGALAKELGAAPLHGLAGGMRFPEREMVRGESSGQASGSRLWGPESVRSSGARAGGGPEAERLGARAGEQEQGRIPLVPVPVPVPVPMPMSMSMPEAIGGFGATAIDDYWHAAVHATPGVRSVFNETGGWISHDIPLRDAAEELAGLTVSVTKSGRYKLSGASELVAQLAVAPTTEVSPEAGYAFAITNMSTGHRYYFGADGTQVMHDVWIGDEGQTTGLGYLRFDSLPSDTPGSRPRGASPLPVDEHGNPLKKVEVTQYDGQSVELRPTSVWDTAQKERLLVNAHDGKVLEETLARKETFWGLFTSPSNPYTGGTHWVINHERRTVRLNDGDGWSILSWRNTVFRSGSGFESVLRSGGGEEILRRPALGSERGTGWDYFRETSPQWLTGRGTAQRLPFDKSGTYSLGVLPEYGPEEVRVSLVRGRLALTGPHGETTGVRAEFSREADRLTVRVPVSREPDAGWAEYRFDGEGQRLRREWPVPRSGAWQPPRSLSMVMHQDGYQLHRRLVAGSPDLLDRFQMDTLPRQMYQQPFHDALFAGHNLVNLFVITDRDTGIRRYYSDFGSALPVWDVPLDRNRGLRVVGAPSVTVETGVFNDFGNEITAWRAEDLGDGWVAVARTSDIPGPVGPVVEHDPIVAGVPLLLSTHSGAIRVPLDYVRDTDGATARFAIPGAPEGVTADYRFAAGGHLAGEDLPLTGGGAAEAHLADLRAAVTRTRDAEDRLQRTHELRGTATAGFQLRDVEQDAGLRSELRGGFTLTEGTSGIRRHYDPLGGLAYRDLPTNLMPRQHAYLRVGVGGREGALRVVGTDGATLAGWRVKQLDGGRVAVVPTAWDHLPRGKRPLTRIVADPERGVVEETLVVHAGGAELTSRYWRLDYAASRPVAVPLRPDGTELDRAVHGLRLMVSSGNSAQIVADDGKVLLNRSTWDLVAGRPTEARILGEVLLPGRELAGMALRMLETSREPEAAPRLEVVDRTASDRSAGWTAARRYDDRGLLIADSTGERRWYLARGNERIEYQDARVPGTQRYIRSDAHGEPRAVVHANGEEALDGGALESAKELMVRQAGLGEHQPVPGAETHITVGMARIQLDHPELLDAAGKPQPLERLREEAWGAVEAYRRLTGLGVQWQHMIGNFAVTALGPGRYEAVHAGSLLRTVFDEQGRWTSYDIPFMDREWDATQGMRPLRVTVTRRWEADGTQVPSYEYELVGPSDTLGRFRAEPLTEEFRETELARKLLGPERDQAFVIVDEWTGNRRYYHTAGPGRLLASETQLESVTGRPIRFLAGQEWPDGRVYDLAGEWDGTWNTHALADGRVVLLGEHDAPLLVHPGSGRIETPVGHDWDEDTVTAWFPVPGAPEGDTAEYWFTAQGAVNRIGLPLTSGGAEEAYLAGLRVIVESGAADPRLEDEGARLFRVEGLTLTDTQPGRELKGGFTVTESMSGVRRHYTLGGVLAYRDFPLGDEHYVRIEADGRALDPRVVHADGSLVREGRPADVVEDAEGLTVRVPVSYASEGSTVEFRFDTERMLVRQQWPLVGDGEWADLASLRLDMTRVFARPTRRSGRRARNARRIPRWSYELVGPSDVAARFRIEPLTSEFRRSRLARDLGGGHALMITHSETGRRVYYTLNGRSLAWELPAGDEAGLWLVHGQGGSARLYGELGNRMTATPVGGDRLMAVRPFDAPLLVHLDTRRVEEPAEVSWNSARVAAAFRLPDEPGDVTVEYSFAADGQLLGTAMPLLGGGAADVHLSRLRVYADTAGPELEFYGQGSELFQFHGALTDEGLASASTSGRGFFLTELLTGIRRHYSADARLLHRDFPLDEDRYLRIGVRGRGSTVQVVDANGRPKRLRQSIEYAWNAEGLTVRVPVHYAPEGAMAEFRFGQAGMMSRQEWPLAGYGNLADLGSLRVVIHMLPGQGLADSLPPRVYELLGPPEVAARFQIRLSPEEPEEYLWMTEDFLWSELGRDLGTDRVLVITDPENGSRAHYGFDGTALTWELPVGEGPSRWMAPAPGASWRAYDELGNRVPTSQLNKDWWFVVPEHRAPLLANPSRGSLQSPTEYAWDAEGVTARFVGIGLPEGTTAEYRFTRDGQLLDGNLPLLGGGTADAHLGGLRVALICAQPERRELHGPNAGLFRFAELDAEDPLAPELRYRDHIQGFTLTELATGIRRYYDGGHHLAYRDIPLGQAMARMPGQDGYLRIGAGSREGHLQLIGADGTPLEGWRAQRVSRSPGRREGDWVALLPTRWDDLPEDGRPLTRIVVDPRDGSLVEETLGIHVRGSSRPWWYWRIDYRSQRAIPLNARGEELGPENAARLRVLHNTRVLSRDGEVIFDRSTWDIVAGRPTGTRIVREEPPPGQELPGIVSRVMRTQHAPTAETHVVAPAEQNAAEGLRAFEHIPLSRTAEGRITLSVVVTRGRAADGTQAPSYRLAGDSGAIARSDVRAVPEGSAEAGEAFVVTDLVTGQRRYYNAEGRLVMTDAWLGDPQQFTGLGYLRLGGTQPVGGSSRLVDELGRPLQALQVESYEPLLQVLALVPADRVEAPLERLVFFAGSRTAETTAIRDATTGAFADGYWMVNGLTRRIQRLDAHGYVMPGQEFVGDFVPGNGTLTAVASSGRRLFTRPALGAEPGPQPGPEWRAVPRWMTGRGTGVRLSLDLPGSYLLGDLPGHRLTTVTLVASTDGGLAVRGIQGIATPVNLPARFTRRTDGLGVAVPVSNEREAGWAEYRFTMRGALVYQEWPLPRDGIWQELGSLRIALRRDPAPGPDGTPHWTHELVGSAAATARFRIDPLTEEFLASELAETFFGNNPAHMYAITDCGTGVRRYYSNNAPGVTSSVWDVPWMGLRIVGRHTDVPVVFDRLGELRPEWRAEILTGRRAVVARAFLAERGPRDETDEMGASALLVHLHTLRVQQQAEVFRDENGLTARFRIPGVPGPSRARVEYRFDNVGQVVHEELMLTGGGDTEAHLAPLRLVGQPDELHGAEEEHENVVRLAWELRGPGAEEFHIRTVESGFELAEHGTGIRRYYNRSGVLIFRDVPVDHALGQGTYLRIAVAGRQEGSLWVAERDALLPGWRAERRDDDRVALLPTLWDDLPEEGRPLTRIVVDPRDGSLVEETLGIHVQGGLRPAWYWRIDYRSRTAMPLNVRGEELGAENGARLMMSHNTRVLFRESEGGVGVRVFDRSNWLPPQRPVRPDEQSVRPDEDHEARVTGRPRSADDTSPDDTSSAGTSAATGVKRMRHHARTSERAAETHVVDPAQPVTTGRVWAFENAPAGESVPPVRFTVVEVTEGTSAAGHAFVVIDRADGHRYYFDGTGTEVTRDIWVGDEGQTTGLGYLRYETGRPSGAPPLLVDAYGCPHERLQVAEVDGDQVMLLPTEAGRGELLEELVVHADSGRVLSETFAERPGARWTGGTRYPRYRRVDHRLRIVQYFEVPDEPIHAWYLPPPAPPAPPAPSGGHQSLFRSEDGYVTIFHGQSEIFRRPALGAEPGRVRYAGETVPWESVPPWRIGQGTGIRLPFGRRNAFIFGPLPDHELAGVRVTPVGRGLALTDEQGQVVDIGAEFAGDADGLTVRVPVRPGTDAARAEYRFDRNGVLTSQEWPVPPAEINRLPTASLRVVMRRASRPGTAFIPLWTHQLAGPPDLVDRFRALPLPGPLSTDALAGRELFAGHLISDLFIITDLSTGVRLYFSDIRPAAGLEIFDMPLAGTDLRVMGSPSVPPAVFNSAGRRMPGWRADMPGGLRITVARNFRVASHQVALDSQIVPDIPLVLDAFRGRVAVPAEYVTDAQGIVTARFAVPRALTPQVLGAGRTPDEVMAEYRFNRAGRVVREDLPLVGGGAGEAHFGPLWARVEHTWPLLPVPDNPGMAVPVRQRTRTLRGADAEAFRLHEMDAELAGELRNGFTLIEPRTGIRRHYDRSGVLFIRDVPLDRLLGWGTYLRTDVRNQERAPQLIGAEGGPLADWRSVRFRHDRVMLRPTLWDDLPPRFRSATLLVVDPRDGSPVVEILGIHVQGSLRPWWYWRIDYRSRTAMPLNARREELGPEHAARLVVSHNTRLLVRDTEDGESVLVFDRSRWLPPQRPIGPDLEMPRRAGDTSSDGASSSGTSFSGTSSVVRIDRMHQPRPMVQTHFVAPAEPAVTGRVEVGEVFQDVSRDVSQGAFHDARDHFAEEFEDARDHFFDEERGEGRRSEPSPHEWRAHAPLGVLLQILRDEAGKALDVAGTERLISRALADLREAGLDSGVVFAGARVLREVVWQRLLEEAHRAVEEFSHPTGAGAPQAERVGGGFTVTAVDGGGHEAVHGHGEARLRTVFDAQGRWVSRDVRLFDASEEVSGLRVLLARTWTEDGTENLRYQVEGDSAQVARFDIAEGVEGVEASPDTATARAFVVTDMATGHRYHFGAEGTQVARDVWVGDEEQSTGLGYLRFDSGKPDGALPYVVDVLGNPHERLVAGARDGRRLTLWPTVAGRGAPAEKLVVDIRDGRLLEETIAVRGRPGMLSYWRIDWANKIVEESEIHGPGGQIWCDPPILSEDGYVTILDPLSPEGDDPSRYRYRRPALGRELSGERSDPDSGTFSPWLFGRGTGTRLTFDKRGAFVFGPLWDHELGKLIVSPADRRLMLSNEFGEVTIMGAEFVRNGDGLTVRVPADPWSDAAIVEYRFDGNGQLAEQEWPVPTAGTQEPLSQLRVVMRRPDPVPGSAAVPLGSYQLAGPPELLWRFHITPLPARLRIEEPGLGQLFDHHVASDLFTITDGDTGVRRYYSNASLATRLAVWDVVLDGPSLRLMMKQSAPVAVIDETGRQWKGWIAQNLGGGRVVVVRDFSVTDEAVPEVRPDGWVVPPDRRIIPEVPLLLHFGSDSPRVESPLEYVRDGEGVTARFRAPGAPLTSPEGETPDEATVEYRFDRQGLLLREDLPLRGGGSAQAHLDSLRVIVHRNWEPVPQGNGVLVARWTWELRGPGAEAFRVHGVDGQDQELRLTLRGGFTVTERETRIRHHYDRAGELACRDIPVDLLIDQSAYLRVGVGVGRWAGGVLRLVGEDGGRLESWRIERDANGLWALVPTLWDDLPKAGRPLTRIVIDPANGRPVRETLGIHRPGDPRPVWYWRIDYRARTAVRLNGRGEEVEQAGYEVRLAAFHGTTLLVHNERAVFDRSRWKMPTRPDNPGPARAVRIDRMTQPRPMAQTHHVVDPAESAATGRVEEILQDLALSGGEPAGLRLHVVRHGEGPEDLSYRLQGPSGAVARFDLAPVGEDAPEAPRARFAVTDAVSGRRYYFGAEGTLVFRDTPLQRDLGYLRYDLSAPSSSDTPPQVVDASGRPSARWQTGPVDEEGRMELLPVGVLSPIGEQRLVVDARSGRLLREIVALRHNMIGRARLGLASPSPVALRDMVQYWVIDYERAQAWRIDPHGNELGGQGGQDARAQLFPADRGFTVATPREGELFERPRLTPSNRPGLPIGPGRYEFRCRALSRRLRVEAAPAPAGLRLVGRQGNPVADVRPEFARNADGLTVSIPLPGAAEGTMVDYRFDGSGRLLAEELPLTGGGPESAHLASLRLVRRDGGPEIHRGSPPELLPSEAAGSFTTGWAAITSADGEGRIERTTVLGLTERATGRVYYYDSRHGRLLAGTVPLAPEKLERRASLQFRVIDGRTSVVSGVFGPDGWRLAGVGVASLGEGRVAVFLDEARPRVAMNPGGGDAALTTPIEVQEECVVDPRTGTLLEETVAVPVEGTGTVEYWRIDYADLTAVRLDPSGRALEGDANTARVVHRLSPEPADVLMQGGTGRILFNLTRNWEDRIARLEGRTVTMRAEAAHPAREDSAPRHG